AALRPGRGHMPLARFEAILALERRASFVLIQGQGEPLLDPTLFEKIAAARARGLVTQVISNGSLLGDAMVGRLCEEGPDVFLVSVDAASPERNERLRAGMAYDDVIRGLAALVRA